LSAECASKKFENATIIGEDIDKSKVARFLAHCVCMLCKDQPTNQTANHR